MGKSLVLIGGIFLLLVGAGVGLSKTNLFRDKDYVSIGVDSLKTTDSTKVRVDTSVFEMPEYNEEAIAQWRQQMAVAQMSPEQRAEYQRQYEAYMKQMEEQQKMIALQKEYERKVKENGGIPPVSDKTQSRIELLKKQFDEKRRRDSIAKANPGVIK